LASPKAYQNLIQVPSSGSALFRIEPGDAARSFLYLKLAGRTNPSLIPANVEIGTPMPNGSDLPPLTADELEAVRRWIYAGAPETGTVHDPADLRGACLPPIRPIRILPLATPAPDAGVQFVMPPYRLEAHSEHEYCFAQYFDMSSSVPTANRAPDGSSFYF